MYVRTLQASSGSGEVKEYVRIVESYREQGKVKQRALANLGPKHLLQEMLTNLKRVLRGTSLPQGSQGDVVPLQDWNWGPILAVRRLFDELGLWGILDGRVPRPNKREAPHAVGLADRVFALVANRLIRPGSEHALAWWLETDYVCDRHVRRIMPPWGQQRRVRVDFRQLQRWYRTLDRWFAAKGLVDVDLYSHAKCDLSAPDALRALEAVRLVEFEVEGQSRRGVTTGSPRARQVLNALGIAKLDPPAGPAEAA